MELAYILDQESRFCEFDSRRQYETLNKFITNIKRKEKIAMTSDFSDFSNFENFITNYGKLAQLVEH